MNVPLVSEYKIDFIKSRLIQTFFGGFKLDLLITESTSKTTILIQLLIFLYPILIGLIFSLIIQFKSTIMTSTESILLLTFSMGFSIQFLIQFCSKQLILMKFKTNQIIDAQRTILTELIGQAGQMPGQLIGQLTSSGGKLLLEEIFPQANKKLLSTQLIQSVVSSLMITLTVINIQIGRLNSQSNVLIIIVFIFVWFTVLLSNYSLSIEPPTELSSTVTINHNCQLSQLLYRPFYVVMTLIILTFVNCYVDCELLKVLLLILLISYPILWFLGFLPQITVLIQWLFEQINWKLFSGLPTTSIWWLIIQLLIQLTLTIIIQFNNIQMTVKLFIISLNGFLLSLNTEIYKLNASASKYFIVFLMILLIISIDSFTISSQSSSSSQNSYCDIKTVIIISLIIILLIIITAINKLQNVFWLNGLLRNPFYQKKLSNSLKVFRFNQKWIIYNQINSWLIKSKFIIKLS